MSKKAFTMVELLAVVAILGIISSIAYPKIINVIGNSRLTAYNVSKKNIVDSAKLKYLADVNSSIVTEYTVPDLVKDGYIKDSAKNPLTDQEYDKNTKVLITNDNGDISYNYVEGNTIYDLVKNKNDNSNVYNENDEFVYKGKDAQNYVVFNGDIYRIIKVDKFRHTYLIRETNDVINKNDIENYINYYNNDNFSENAANKMWGKTGILTNVLYKQTILNGSSFINVDNNVWLKDEDTYKVITIDNEFTNEEKANMFIVIKLNNNVVITSGEGTQINPYVVED